MAAQTNLAVAAVAGHRPRSDHSSESSSKPTGNVEEDSICAEVGAALGLTARAAMAEVERGRAAAGALGEVTQRMLTGRWSGRYLWHAMDVTAGHRTPHVLFAVAAAVEGAEACTPRQFRNRLRRELCRIDSRAAARRIRARRRERSVSLWEQEDFRAELSLQAPWQVASFIHRQLDRWAHAERDRLRDIRRINPTAQLCCPEAVASALALIAARELPGDHPGDHAGGSLGDQSDDDACGGDGANPILGKSAEKDARGGKRQSSAQRPCEHCGSTDRRLPSLSELRADAMVVAARLLAGELARREQRRQAVEPSSRPAGPAGPAAPSSEPLPPTDGAFQGDFDDSAGRDEGAGPSAETLPLIDDSDITPKRGRRWRHAIVLVDLATVLGAADNPGYVPGYGYVPGEIARELAAEATQWRRFLLDRAGRLVDAGVTGYRPPERLREFVTARDMCCTFPGCGRPSTEADLDHRVNFDGTNTKAGNLHPLCRTHHRVKTYAGWQLWQDSEHVTHWVSPSGRHYVDHPESPWGGLGSWAHGPG